MCWGMALGGAGVSRTSGKLRNRDFGAADGPDVGGGSSVLGAQAKFYTVVCVFSPRGIRKGAATRVRRGLLIQFPTANEYEKVISLRSAISLLVTS